LCTSISRNRTSQHPAELYSARRDIINFFERIDTQDFDFYGTGWGSGYKNYKGSIPVKLYYLKYYKFCFCYENIKGIPGYISEKIFDCFWAGCVPIYWGAPNIADAIPRDCFIAREDFDSNEALYAFIKNMSQEKYEQYLVNIRKFLASDAAYLYTKDKYVEIMVDLISQKKN
jgi:hypothetical protein